MKPKGQKKKVYIQKTVYPFLSQMYKIFDTNPHIYVLTKLYAKHGDYNWYGEEIIRLDYRKDLISAMVHETLHHLHPYWSETKVIREERKIMNSLGPVQVKHILQRYVQSL